MHPGFSGAASTESIITKVSTVKQAKALPPASVVGDPYGGLTFTDVVAATLETRSAGGWHDIQVSADEIWTIIILNR
jgi:hypothetical protein